MRKAAINNLESDFANSNKTFSQSFKYQWLTQFELAREEIRNSPYVSFTAFPNRVKAGEKVVFNNQSRGIKSCTWSFGDGGSSASTDVNVEHIYNKPGKYDVKLVVRGNDGKSRTLLIKEYITVE